MEGHRFIGEADVERGTIDIAKDGNAGDVEFAQGADDAHSDFATVGDEDFAEHEF